MDRIWRTTANKWVIFGFALSAASSLVSSVRILNLAGLFTSTYIMIQSIGAPLVGVTTALAWWSLTSLRDVNESQASILRRSYLWFGAVYLLLSITFTSYLIESTSYPQQFWTTTVTGLQTLGALVTFVGFTMLARETTGEALAWNAGDEDEVPARWRRDPDAPDLEGRD